MNLVELQEKLAELRKKKNSMVYFSRSSGYNMQNHGKLMEEVEDEIAEIIKRIGKGKG